MANLQKVEETKLKMRMKMRALRARMTEEQAEAQRVKQKLQQRKRRELMKTDTELTNIDRLKNKLRQRQRRLNWTSEEMEVQRLKAKLRTRQRRESKKVEELEANRLNRLATISKKSSDVSKWQNSNYSQRQSNIDPTSSKYQNLCHIFKSSKILDAELRLRNIDPETTVFLEPIEPFQCHYCLSSHQSQHRLETHALANHGFTSVSQLKNFSCSICPEILYSRGDLVNHIKGHERNDLEDTLFFYICDFDGCFLQFTDKGQFKEHVSNHQLFPGEDLHCKQCDKYFALETNLVTHLNKVHQSADQESKVVSVDCPFCWGIFSQGKLLHHLQEHTLVLSTFREEQPKSFEFLCDECGKVCSNGRMLYNHRRTVHDICVSKPKSVCHDCQICSKRCDSQVRLHGHILRYHTYEHGLLCYVCDQRFQTLHSLQIHLQRHSGKPFLTSRFNCSYCTKVFSGVMMRNKHHVLAHSDKYLLVRPFYCIACHVNFESEKERDVHYEKHLKWKCVSCELHHFSEGTFKSHMAAHDRRSGRVGKLRSRKTDNADRKLMEVGDPIDEVLEDEKQETIRRLRENAQNYSFVIKRQFRDPVEQLTETLETTLDDFQNQPNLGKKRKVTEQIGPKTKKKKSSATRKFANYGGNSKNPEGITVIINQELEFKCETCAVQFSFPDEVLRHHIGHEGYHDQKDEIVTADIEEEAVILSKYKNTNFEQIECSKRKSIFQCNLCGKKFDSAYDAVEHRKEAHGIDPVEHVYKFGCDICPRRFHEERYLIRHKRDVHSGNEDTKTLGLLAVEMKDKREYALKLAEERSRLRNLQQLPNDAHTSIETQGSDGTNFLVMRPPIKPPSNTPNAIRKRRQYERNKLKKAAMGGQLDAEGAELQKSQLTKVRNKYWICKKCMFACTNQEELLKHVQTKHMATRSSTRKRKNTSFIVPDLNVDYEDSDGSFDNEEDEITCFDAPDPLAGDAPSILNLQNIKTEVPDPMFHTVDLGEILSCPSSSELAEQVSRFFPVDIEETQEFFETKEGIILFDTEEETIIPEFESGPTKSIKCQFSKNFKQAYSKMRSRVLKHIYDGINAETKQLVQSLPFAYVFLTKLSDFEKPIADSAERKPKTDRKTESQTKRNEKMKLKGSELKRRLSGSKKKLKSVSETQISRNLESDRLSDIEKKPSSENRLDNEKSKPKAEVTELKEVRISLLNLDKPEMLEARMRRFSISRKQEKSHKIFEEDEKPKPEFDSETEPKNEDSDWNPSDENSNGNKKVIRSKTMKKTRLRSVSKTENSNAESPSDAELCKVQTDDMHLPSKDEGSETSTDEVERNRVPKRKRIRHKIKRRKRNRAGAGRASRGEVLCNLCSENCFTKQNLREHRWKEHWLELNHCVVETCKRTFSKREFFLGHVERVHRGIEKPFKCAECTTLTMYFHDFQRHCRFVHKMPNEVSSQFVFNTFVKTIFDLTSNYFCDFCGDFFVGSNAYNRHVRTHVTPSEEKLDILEMFLCDFDGCNSVFRGLENLERHFKTHCPTGHFSCSTCAKIFAQAKSLDQHVENVHTNECYECPFCVEIFEAIEVAERHEALHKIDLNVELKDLEVEAAETRAIRNQKRGDGKMKNHKCGQCERFFKSALTLEFHVEKAHNGNRNPKPWKCDHCDRAFSQPSRLHQHQQIYHGLRVDTLVQLTTRSYLVEFNPTYHCEICSAIVKGKHRYNVHIRTHFKTHEMPSAEFPSELVMFLCDYKDCNQMYRGKELLLKHFESHCSEDPDGGPFQCTACPKIFAQKENLEEHVNTVHNKESKMFGCSYCADAFRSKKIMVRHEKLHIVDLTIPLQKCMCELCGREMTSMSGLKLHKRKHHSFENVTVQNESVKKPAKPKKKERSCPYCDKYAYKDIKFKHQYNHHREQFVRDNPFFCDLCYRPEKTEHFLKIHRQSHDNMKCKICGKQFLRKQYFDTHMQSHKGDRPFKCTECDRSFTTKMVLREHMLRHEKRYYVFCSICPNNSVGFYRPCHLEQHMQSVHVNGNGEMKRRGRKPGSKNRFQKIKVKKTREDKGDSSYESEDTEGEEISEDGHFDIFDLVR